MRSILKKTNKQTNKTTTVKSENVLSSFMGGNYYLKCVKCILCSQLGICSMLVAPFSPASYSDKHPLSQSPQILKYPFSMQQRSHFTMRINYFVFMYYALWHGKIRWICGCKELKIIMVLSFIHMLIYQYLH